jgi:hypothetical protein
MWDADFSWCLGWCCVGLVRGAAPTLFLPGAFGAVD